jgi:hypothetical protein
LLISSSRSLFRDILLIQNSLLLLFSSLGFNTSQSFPWKNSPSQKIAILYFVSTISGLPGNFL